MLALQRMGAAAGGSRGALWRRCSSSAAKQLNVVHSDDEAAASSAPHPPVVLLHGLLGSASNLRTLARALTERSRLLVDLTDHGASPHGSADTPLALDELAVDVEAVLERVVDEAGGPVDLVGHSLGGKVGMAVALRRPALLRRMVVLDIAPVDYRGGAVEGANSVSAVVAAAARVDLEAAGDRRGVDAALEAEGVRDAGTRAFVASSLVVRRGELLRWRFNLSRLAASLGELASFPLEAPPGTPPSPVRTLFLYGERSPYVTSEAAKDACRAFFPDGALHGLPDAGHWVHAEAPRAVAELTQAHLDSE